MDFLNKYLEQLRDLFASMTPGARLTTGALLAVVVVSIGFLFKQSTSGPDEYLYGGEPLTRQELIDVQHALSQADLSDYAVHGNMVKVPRTKKHLYLAAIASADAGPKDGKSIMADAINGLSPLSSNVQQQQQYKAAREQQFSSNISNMNWVEHASVMYDEKDVRGLRRMTVASATVSVRPKVGEVIDTRRQRALQNMVSGAFTSMKPADVVIINLNGDELAGNAEVSPDDFHTLYLREQARLESAKKAVVQQLLSHIRGAKVQIKVELDEKLSEESLATRPEGTPVTTHESEMEETSKMTNNDGGAPPGLTASGPSRGTRDPAPARTNSSESTVRKAESTTKPFEARVATVTSGLVPKSMWASIEIPREYVIGIWRKKKLEEEGKEPDLVAPEEVKLVEAKIINDIKTSVEPLMTELSAGKDDFSQVKVVVYDTVPSDPIPEPSIASQGLYWLGEYGNSLAMLGLAAFSLLMLRTMVRGGSTDEPLGGPALQLKPEKSAGAAGETEMDDDNRPKLRLKKPDPVKDDLAEMVRDDPDAAAAILSNWISNAS
ncbi:flagellar MS-ring protein [Posidoniimonas polymericola]|uniref:Flagellar MS-ring protein n=1 Tax=Posidoniimonas polymericola TaxID=2528002 RepID=A0A5C5YQM6_9BACT|nr:hypothetical protein [Posidoniimonas polymericola]TWT77216.1 flagellar MS-ring protein [Posidoniimonas polymericola]